MSEQNKVVNALVERVERHQKALKLNDARFVARYQRHLGSVDTWRRRLCARKFDELGRNLDKWETKLRLFVAELDGQASIEDYIDQLPIAQYGMQLFDVLQDQRTDRRVGWLIGPTGVGKSWTMAHVKSRNESHTVYLHINRGAKESMMQISTKLARATNATMATSAAATFENVVEALIANPLTLIIDDVHEGGVLMLKLLKHLVDDTRVKLILGTYPTAWNALVNGSTDAHSEAQQLIGRSIKPIDKRWFKGVGLADVTAYLDGALGKTQDHKITAERIGPTLVRNGNFRALVDAVELARINADEAGESLDAELVEEALRVICPSER